MPYSADAGYEPQAVQTFEKAPKAEALVEAEDCCRESADFPHCCHPQPPHTLAR